MKTKTDNRPRFGFAQNLDDNPQVVYEKSGGLGSNPIPVVVIPLPYVSAKVRKKVREFVNGTLWPKE